MKEYEFRWPDQNKGYRLFPLELEQDPLVLFHVSSKSNFEPITKQGFKAAPPLESVSYTKGSEQCLTYRALAGPPEEKVAFAVRFQSLDAPGIVVNNADIHVYDERLQPEIVGYCFIPLDYRHR